jgi:hypothetical protein
MVFTTGLCRLCDASLQMGVGKIARGITASNMSPTQRTMQLVKQWPRIISCRWIITKTHKIYRIKMPLLHFIWASNSQSPMPLHLQWIWVFRPKRNADARRIYAHAAAKILLWIPCNRFGTLAIYQQLANNVESTRSTTCYKDDMWEWYSMGATQDDSTSGFAEQMITRGILFVPGTCRLHMRMIFHVGKSKLPNMWIRGK